MNSHSSWICRDNGPPDHLNEKNAFIFESKKKQCSERIKSVESALRQVSLPAELEPVANRRMETAKRFFRSDELGGCNYELHVLELFIDQIRDQSSQS